MKKQFMFTPTSALFFALICLTFFSCQDEEVSDQLPFLSGTVEVPTQLICGDPVSIPIVDGENAEIGKVEIYNDLDNIYISVFSSGKWFLKGTNLFVGASAEIPLNTDGKANIDEFNYKFSHSPLIENHIVEISLDEINDCSTLALQVEAVELDESGNSLGETTGWLKGDLISDGSQGMKHQHCLGECVVKYPIDAIATFAFEDLAPQKGDADYNDFVVQMNSKEYYQGKQIQKIEMEFLAKARGAGFDHGFLINIPFEGSANVLIERFNGPLPNSLQSRQVFEHVKEGDLQVSVFPSTKISLPSTNDDVRVNTIPQTTLLDYQLAKVTILIKEGRLLSNSPYDPFLRVKDTNSEIHILELTQKIDADGDGQKDYWQDEKGIHPFGIVMHNAWVWPLEEVYIKNVYPNYKFVIENGVFKPADPKWYETPQEGTDYFRPELFN